MTENTKTKLITETSKIVFENGLEGLSIRKVASLVGCTSGAIYVHFKNFNHLVLLSCLTFLKEYNQGINKMDKNFENSLEESKYIWKIFCESAFKYPEIFYFIFFSCSEINMSKEEKETDAYAQFKSFYKAFPEGFEDTKYKHHQMLLKLDLEERNKYLIMKLAHEKLISPSHVKLLNLSQIFIFKGYLEKAKKLKDQSQIERLRKACIKSIDMSFSAYLV